MKRSVACLSGLLVVLLAACGGSDGDSTAKLAESKRTTTSTTARPSGTTVTTAPPPPTTAPPKTWGISIKNFTFSPPVLQIHVGDTVVVKNDDSPTHTWTADDGSFDSGDLAPGATSSHTFAKAGTVTYHCNIHSSMKGTIQVS